MGSKLFEPQSSIVCLSDLISGILQHLDEQPAHRRLIFDDQDRGYTQCLTAFPSDAPLPITHHITRLAIQWTPIPTPGRRLLLLSQPEG